MDIRVTPKISANYSSNQKSMPNFTAMLKGSAVRSAIQFSKDTFQLSEVSEIIDNVAKIGDRITIIDCSYDGMVRVSNSKLGKTVYQSKLKKNETSSNPYLEMLRVFNSKSGINKYEEGLLNRVFSHSKRKQDLYNMLRTYNFAPTTKFLFEYEASKYPEIVKPTDVEIIFKKNALEEMKATMLKRLSSHF